MYEATLTIPTASILKELRAALKQGENEGVCITALQLINEGSRVPGFCDEVYVRVNSARKMHSRHAAIFPEIGAKIVEGGDTSTLSHVLLLSPHSHVPHEDLGTDLNTIFFEPPSEVEMHMLTKALDKYLGMSDDCYFVDGHEAYVPQALQRDGKQIPNPLFKFVADNLSAIQANADNAFNATNKGKLHIGTEVFKGMLCYNMIPTTASGIRSFVHRSMQIAERFYAPITLHAITIPSSSQSLSDEKVAFTLGVKAHYVTVPLANLAEPRRKPRRYIPPVGATYRMGLSIVARVSQDDSARTFTISGAEIHSAIANGLGVAETTVFVPESFEFSHALSSVSVQNSRETAAMQSVLALTDAIDSPAATVGSEADETLAMTLAAFHAGVKYGNDERASGEYEILVSGKHLNPGCLRVTHSGDAQDLGHVTSRQKKHEEIPWYILFAPRFRQSATTAEVKTHFSFPRYVLASAKQRTDKTKYANYNDVELQTDAENYVSVPKFIGKDSDTPFGLYAFIKANLELLQNPQQTAYYQKDQVYIDTPLIERSASYRVRPWVVDMYKCLLTDIIGDTMIPDLTVTITDKSHAAHAGYTMRLFFWINVNLELVDAVQPSEIEKSPFPIVYASEDEGD
jgi:hypothetical protein